VALPGTEANERIWLRFDGVDYTAKVYLNGNTIGSHEGLFSPFEFDVTEFVNPGAENVLLVQVENDAIMMGNHSWDSNEEGDKLYAATGPGWDDPEIGWHHCPPGMGIYRKVYFETRPEVFIEDAWVRPFVDVSAIELWLEIQSLKSLQDELSASVSIFGRNFESVVLENEPVTLNGKPGVGRNYYRIRLSLDSPKLWSPEEPWLYALQVRIGEDLQEVVFGMRDFCMESETEPKGRLSLNGLPIRLRGINTMGHEQQCVMAGDGPQLLDDLLIYKMAGINYIRFTQRPVEREVYELCDALGLMAQADLPLFKNLRRNQFNEAVRQCSEMERFVRRHPSVVMTSLINEPFPLAWHNALHRHLGKEELDVFFQSATHAILLENPDRVIKPVDGDYDPPSPGLPDNHCYTLWYNGHMIPFGKLEAGYWQPVKPGWVYACGEYGAEGLDPVDLMRRRYPAEWLPTAVGEEADWTPRQIRKAQTGDMYQVFYDKPDTLEDWVESSQIFQAWVVKEMTEAFRRDSRMVSFALHLGIDAFPSGWMKTIVDCERRPKKAFFAFRDALAPVLPSLRAPRRFWWEKEMFEAEVWISNDRSDNVRDLQLRIDVYRGAEVIASTVETIPELPACDSTGWGSVNCPLPCLSRRESFTMCMQVVNADQKILGASHFDFEVFPSMESIPEADFPSLLDKDLISRAKAGETVVCGPLAMGTYAFENVEFAIKPIGMGELIFCSRSTGHPLVQGFASNDFRLWYDDELGYASCFADSVIVGDGWEPVLLAGRGGFGEAWTPAPVVAEKRVGDGRLIISQLQFEGRLLKNPPAALFVQRLRKCMYSSSNR
jgi:hypothetical protein